MLTIVHSIVFVHGLNGQSKNTWTSENDVFWPKDLLSKTCPDVRILTYGYDSRIADLVRGLRSSVNRHGVDLISKLALSRSTAEAARRPLIFVAHSLGGLIVKSALVASSTANTDSEKAVGLSTGGIIFFATPHQGCSHPVTSFADLLRRIGSIYPEDSNAFDLSDEESKILRLELDQFKSISNDVLMSCFYESSDSVRPVIDVCSTQRAQIILTYRISRLYQNLQQS
jgi:hypothetical protein